MRSEFRRLALLLAAIVALAACGGTHESPSATPQRPEGASVVGTPVAGEVAFARETMAESRAFEALAPETIGAPRVIPFLKLGVARRQSMVPASPGTRSWAGEFSAFPGPSAPSAPALLDNIAGLTDPGNIIPPDTMGAAGPTELLETLNTGVGVFGKATGAQISKVTLNTFWSSVRGALDAFDPRSLYDHNSGRFVAISIAGQSSSASRLLIGVSLSDNASGAWNKFGISAVAGSTWADFDCLGVDDNNVYVTANMFNDSDVFQFVKAWVFPKAQLFAGSLTSWTEFVDPVGTTFTVQPAHTFGASGGAEYLLHEGYADTTFPTPPTRRFLRVSRIASPSGVPTWSDLGYVEVANYPFLIPNAPQPGSALLIETNDTRLLNVIYANGALWTTHAVANAAGTKTEIAWYRINPASGGGNLGTAGKPLQQGRVADASRFYYFPSIAVNWSGDAALGFSGSSSSEYASAFYTGRASADPDNTMQSVGLLKAGTNVYTKDFGTGRIRWGDYSATTMDPGDSNSFWTVQEYATSPDNTWDTWWGHFAFSSPTVPNRPAGLTATAASPTQIDLGWVDNSANEAKFLIERSPPPGTSFVQVATAIANATSFSDTGLAPETQYFYRVRAANGAGSSDNSNVASATTLTLTLPNPPTGLAATAVSASQINLAWTDASTDETGFIVRRSETSGSGYVQVGTAPANATAFSDSGLTAGKTYYYVVLATKTGAGDSAPSNEASATTPTPGGGGGGGGGCSVAPGRMADGGASAGRLIVLGAPLLALAVLRRRRP